MVGKEGSFRSSLPNLSRTRGLNFYLPKVFPHFLSPKGFFFLFEIVCVWGGGGGGPSGRYPQNMKLNKFVIT